MRAARLCAEKAVFPGVVRSQRSANLFHAAQVSGAMGNAATGPPPPRLRWLQHDAGTDSSAMQRLSEAARFGSRKLGADSVLTPPDELVRAVSAFLKGAYRGRHRVRRLLLADATQGAIRHSCAVTQTRSVRRSARRAVATVALRSRAPST